jgi:hypothetical protein
MAICPLYRPVRFEMANILALLESLLALTTIPPICKT